MPRPMERLRSMLQRHTIEKVVQVLEKALSLADDGTPGTVEISNFDQSESSCSKYAAKIAAHM